MSIGYDESNERMPLPDEDCEDATLGSENIGAIAEDDDDIEPFDHERLDADD